MSDDPVKTSDDEINPLYDPATDNAPIEDNVQELLNKPLEHPEGIEPADQAFLDDIIAKFESGVIQPHVPSSLVQTAVYDQLDQDGKSKVDQNAFNILSALRRIYDLWQLDHHITFQMKHELHDIRLKKEDVESKNGDVFLI
jgi:hypothetical protein